MLSRLICCKEAATKKASTTPATAPATAPATTPATAPVPAPAPTHSKADDEAARQRQAEEAQRIIEETAQKRKAKAKALVGEQAESIGQRKDEVHDSLEQWVHKGTETEADVSDIKNAHLDVGNVKAAYADSIHRFNEKGKTHPTKESAGEITSDLQGKFDKESNVPTLFAYDPVAATKSPRKQQDAKSSAGGSGGGSNSVKVQEAMEKIKPKGWDGVTYHSLVDLRQRRVQGIDMQNREQYLSPQEFKKAFKMTKEEFAVAPKWKRDKIKSGLHLF